MVIETALAALVGVFAAQSLNAAVSAMSKPKRDDGAYAYWFKFLHAEASIVTSLIEKKVDGLDVQTNTFVKTETAITPASSTDPKS